RPRGGVQPLSVCEFATDSGGRPVTPAIAVTARAAHRLSRCEANRDWQWPLSVPKTCCDSCCAMLRQYF
ncbi:unnamed protein product, partial [Mycena citricolor]